ncbi:DsbA family protein [bacterium]|nr:DsbA family protein [bacterium]
MFFATRSTRTAAAFVYFVAVSTMPGSAQQSTSATIEMLQKRVSDLELSQTEIMDRLEKLESTLKEGSRRSSAKAFSGANISVDDAPQMGEEDAKFALIEFSDYQCPYCRRFSANTLPQIVKDYVETGKLKYFFRDFPLERIHPAAAAAAIAGRCAGAQGMYWKMHDLLFEDQRSVAMKKWRKLASDLNLNLDLFDACMNDDRHYPEIQRSIAEGRQLGITGTPAFFLGAISADGTVEATKMVVGAKSYAGFKVTIDGLLSDKPD